MSGDIFDLEAKVKLLAGKFPIIESIYLFGSRRYETGSSRSDIDILLVVNDFVKPSLLREFVLEYGSALDLFILREGRATSVANESFIESTSNDELIKSLNAIKLYSQGDGCSSELNSYKNMEIDKRVIHKLTSLPNNSTETFEVKALQKIFKSTREQGLTSKPYIGSNSDEASIFLIKMIRNLISAGKSVSGHGEANSGWSADIKSEYDFQNLFWIVVKPWLPNLSREDVELKYDGQNKKSDFNLFNNQIVLEMKYIKDSDDKRETIKTLEGLKMFYTQHPNIRVLIFVILVKENVELDDTKWESDYTYENESPAVRTVVLRNN